MRRGTATPRGRLVGLALVFLAGCVWPGAPRPDGPAEPFFAAAGPRGSDAVLLDVAVLELPVGDRYANGGLWDEIDEQAVALDRKAALDDNGFRVGVVGVMRPTRFADLLESPRTNPNGRRVQMRAGNPRVVTLGEPRPVCQFRVAAQPTPVAFEQAQCAVQVTPELASGGGVKLTFVPLVQHGTKSPWPGLAAGTDADAAAGRPTERYPALGWDVTVEVGQYVVVGARFDQPGTLGHQCFVTADGPRSVQRLLAIRAARVVPAAVEGSDQ